MFDVLTNYLDDDKVENGVWMDLTDSEGDLIYIDPVNKQGKARIKVRSTASQSYDQHLDDTQRRAVARTKRLKGNKQREAVLAELKKEKPSNFSYVVVEMENVSRAQPGVIKPPREDLFSFAKNPKHGWVVDQVLEYSADDRNYVAEGARPKDDDEEPKPKGEPDPSTSGAGAA